MPLGSLEPGDRYCVVGIPTLKGRVVSHGQMGSRVRYGLGLKTTTIVADVVKKTKAGKEVETVTKTFTKPVDAEIVSSATMVLPLTPVVDEG